MKSAPHATYYTAMTYLTGFFAIVAFAFALLFCGFGETQRALLCLGLLVLLSALSLCYRQLGKPTSWSRIEGVYNLR